MADWDKETGEQKGPPLQLPPVSAWSKRTLEGRTHFPGPKHHWGRARQEGKAADRSGYNFAAKVN